MGLAFWDSVNAEIKRKNTTQEWVARQAGIKYQTFRGWVSKGILPRVDEAVAIVRALGVSVEYMIAGQDDSKEYAELRLLALAKKYSDFLECLESLDPLTLETVRVQVKAVARASSGTRSMVAAETAKYGENAK